MPLVFDVVVVLLILLLKLALTLPPAPDNCAVELAIFDNRRGCTVQFINIGTVINVMRIHKASRGFYYRE